MQALAKQNKELPLDYTQVAKAVSPSTPAAHIATRIRQKRLSGETLSRIERHLGKQSAGLQRAVCGPSLTEVLGQLCRHSIKPLAVLLICTLAIRAYVLHDTSFDTERIVVSPGFRTLVSTIVSKDAHASLASKNAASANDSIDLSAQVLPEELVFSPAKQVVSSNTPALAPLIAEPQLTEQQNLLKFITGVIVVFRPGSENAGEIARHIVKISKDNDLDPLFVASVISSESGFRTKARSSVGALGLMQLRPSTAREVLEKMTEQDGGAKIKQYLENPEINIRLGIEYLKQLERSYNGNRYLALAAYNWGPGNLAKAKRKGRKIPGSVQHYASSILERTIRWQRHFHGARIAAQTLSDTPESLHAVVTEGGRSKT